MQMTGNTILITGGGSGIGRGLAEAFHRLGNQVIIAGRRLDALEAVLKANPGMKSIRLDVTDPADIEYAAEQILRDAPGLNIVIHNAGIMQSENLAQGGDLKVAEAIIATNLLGPIRLNDALLPHLLKQPRAAVVTVSSGLAFVPKASTPAYSATKAAIHSWTQSLRHQLTGTSVEVLEIAPPYVQTELTGAHQATDPNAMPLDAFIAEAMAIMGRDGATEVIVERCRPLRDAEKNGNHPAVFAKVNAAA